MAKKKPAVKKKSAPKKKLTAQQLLFAHEYMVDRNATQAAIRAGYSSKTAQFQSSRLLRNVMVKAVIDKSLEKLTAKTDITVERVVTEIARIGLFDPRKLFNEDGYPKDIMSLDDDTAAAIAGIKVVSFGNAEHGVGTILEYKIANKNDAAEKLMRYLGAYERDNKQKTDPLLEILSRISGSSLTPVDE